MKSFAPLGMIVVLSSLAFGSAVKAKNPDDAYTPKIAAASTEGRDAMRRFRVPDGLTVELYAAEPMLANPVAFCVDEKNRLYVAETFRLHQGVTDTRNHMNWLDADLACRTVADRVAMYRKYLGNAFESYSRDHDRIRLLEDRDGDGKADHSTVFADGFHDASEGLGAGLLARKGGIYYTNIPNLWRLRDTDGDGKADERKTLSSGYGVHVGFLGHDLHGLRVGPDGRVYFSVGDRGLNVKTADSTLFAPDTGSVLRCDPDGSNLEIFATGLRNPQELVFNEQGDLFTVDNNSDAGDRARLVHLVAGGDSGWRIGWQFIESPNSRGPWNAEKMWHPQNQDQPSFLIPPLANLSDGPSGLTYYPGTGLNDAYQGTFFLCDFRGSSGNSGVRSFSVKPKGASYELAEQKEFLWRLEATDVDFGTDGALYVSDWVEGWDLTGKGRIYKVFDPKRAEDPTLREVKSLLAAGFDQHSIEALTRLLSHSDMRIRQEAQFALVDRATRELRQQPAQGGDSKTTRPAAFASIMAAASRGNVTSRRHAIWALGQVERARESSGTLLVDLLSDSEAEVRFQAARVLADLLPRRKPCPPGVALGDKLLAALRDADPRVRFHAALGLGRLGEKLSLEQVLTLIEKNQDRDPYLRHAGAVALAGMGEPARLSKLAESHSPFIRMAGVLALRKQGRSELSRFLDDSDSRIVLEAARAINDLSINDALPALAALVDRSSLALPLWRRVIDANLQNRGSANAENLAKLSTRSDVPEAIRIEALDTLGHWAQPSGRDRVTGLWHPLPDRPAMESEQALKPVVEVLVSGAPNRVRVAAAQAVAAIPIRSVGAPLERVVLDPARSAKTRVEALKALGAIEYAKLAETTARAVTDAEPLVRAEGLRQLAKLRPSEAIPALDSVIDSGTLAEKQSALSTLGGLKEPQADEVLIRRLGQLRQGKIAAEIQLDLLDAAAGRASEPVKKNISEIESIRPKDDPLSPYRVALLGGNSERGRKVFREKAAVECLRCHKIDGNGGEVGPDLTGIGKRQTREYLLEAIIDPNKQIAQGFETIVLALADGTIVTGILKGEDAKALRLITAEGKLVNVTKSDVEERKRGASAMPEDTIKKLSRAELRDVIEFLSGSR
jgi:quinoprotein glucose dehydrogenase